MKNYVLKIGETEYRASVLEINDHTAKISVDETVYDIVIKEFRLNGMKPVGQVKPARIDADPVPGSAAVRPPENRPPVSGDGIKSPMPGIVLGIHVKEGERITAGDKALTIEAMKMENEIKAPYDGIVGKIHAGVNESVTEDELLIELKRPAMTTL